MYPPVVAGLGGPDKAADFLKRGVQAGLAAGRAPASSVEVDEPGEIVTQGSRMFSLIPAAFKAENAKQKIVRHTFLLAISDDGGADWSFILGITPKMAANLKSLSLPPDFKIPEPQPEVITVK